MSNSNNEPTKRPRPTLKKANLFNKDLKSMMYAYGDTDTTNDSVAVLEDILIDFITELCLAAGQARSKVKVDDFKFVLRRDPKKLGRVEELLNLQKEIQQAKKLFDEEEG